MGRGASGIMFGKIHVYSENESLSKIQEVFEAVMAKYGDEKKQQPVDIDVDELLEEEDEDDEEEEDEVMDVDEEGVDAGDEGEGIEGEKPVAAVAPWLRKKNGAA